MKQKTFFVVVVCFQQAATSAGAGQHTKNSQNEKV
jgi:hypothetical protein